MLNDNIKLKQKFIIAFVIALLLVATQVHASEIEPRSFVNTPVGVNFLLLGFGYLNGNLPDVESPPIKDAKLRVNTEGLSYVRSFDLFGKSGKFDVIFPYSQLSGSALVVRQRRERNIYGLNDPRFRFTINFYGAPALSPQEFASYQQDVIIGASLQVSAPLGQYDASKLVNLGNNRWFVKPDIGISKAWGPFSLELSTGAYFYSNNNDYFGGRTFAQNPVSTTQLHLTYYFTGGAWAALSGTYDTGGRITINGVESNEIQRNLRVGATFALPVNKNNSIKFYGNDGVATSAGCKFYMVGVVWQYRWGNGL